jgi:hypothetical protein
MAWKEVLCDGAQSAMEYFMPDLASDMDPTRELTGIPGMELYPEGSDSDKGMRISDVFFDVPMRSRENGNVAVFVEQQDEKDEHFALRVFETYIRMREKRRVKTTGFAIYTGDSPDVATYSESCYGFEVFVKFRTFHIPSKCPDELRSDKRPFARVVLASRLSLDAGNDVGLREKYAMEILNTTGEQDYDRKKRLFILDFSRRIFRLNDPEIGQKVKEVYEMQTVSLREYGQQVKRELDKEEGRVEGRKEGRIEGRKEGRVEGREKGREEKAFEVARKMLARNMSVSDIIDLTGLGEKEILAIR